MTTPQHLYPRSLRSVSGWTETSTVSTSLPLMLTQIPMLDLSSSSCPTFQAASDATGRFLGSVVRSTRKQCDEKFKTDMIGVWEGPLSAILLFNNEQISFIIKLLYGCHSLYLKPLCTVSCWLWYRLILKCYTWIGPTTSKKKLSDWWFLYCNF